MPTNNGTKVECSIGPRMLRRTGSREQPSFDFRAVVYDWPMHPLFTPTADHAEHLLPTPNSCLAEERARHLIGATPRTECTTVPVSCQSRSIYRVGYRYGDSPGEHLGTLLASRVFCPGHETTPDAVEPLPCWQRGLTAHSDQWRLRRGWVRPVVHRPRAFVGDES
jgi:hypothetical protein